MKKKPNFLIIGASGGVANALLQHLVHHRDYFNNLILLDKNKKVLSDPYLDHKNLRYQFVHKKLELPKKEKEYHHILKKYKIDLALDITDMNSIPLIESTNKFGISIMNTGANDHVYSIMHVMLESWRRRKEFSNAPHILCTGMNPGVVNMWVRHGIEKFGMPNEIIHFEYDTSHIEKKWHPIMTWSVREFLEECVEDPAGLMKGKNKPEEYKHSPLEHRLPMKSLLEPVLKLPEYPRGFLVTHEECISLAQKYNIPSKFIYAVNMQTMDMLVAMHKKNKQIDIQDLIKGDNTQTILDGSDNIGVALEYKNKRVYYLNSMPNMAIVGTNGTYTQVVIGIMAAIFTLICENLKPGLYFPEDLYDNHYKYYVFDNMRIQEFVFQKNKKHLKLKQFNPMVKIRRSEHFEHLYI